MSPFILGMIVMYCICGFIVLICNTFNVHETIKDFLVGGIVWYPIVIINYLIVLVVTKYLKKKGK